MKKSIEFQTQTYTLKSGDTISIRIADLADAQKLLDLKRDYLKDTTTIPLTLEEYPNNLKNEEQIITEYLNTPNSVLLIATFNNELIGNIDLTGSKRAKMFHTGMIGMGIKENWRNKGLGRLLINAVIAWAKNHSAIELLWLDVYASNELGYSLYKNTGFKVSGIIKDFFKKKNGYNDKIQMYQHIK